MVEVAFVEPEVEIVVGICGGVGDLNFGVVTTNLDINDFEGGEFVGVTAGEGSFGYDCVSYAAG